MFREVPGYNPREKANFLSIIFVHGLTGHLTRTWTVPGSAAPWPQELLPKIVKVARILAFGYDSRMTDWNSVSQNRIGNHSRNLLQEVADYRENDMTVDSFIFLFLHILLVILIRYTRITVLSYLWLTA